MEALIKVVLQEEDYREQVDKELKGLQKKAQMPGFRPGKVPIGLVKKLYGKSVLVEEVNKILADALFKYIKDNNLNVLGNPMPDQASADAIDWDSQDAFTFEYRVGLAPGIDLELTEEIEVEMHQIKVADEMLEEQLKHVRQRFGKMSNPGTAEEEDVVMGEFVEMQDEKTPMTDGHTHSANVFIRFIRDEKVKNEFIGSKAGSEVVMDVLKAVESESEAAGMLGLKKEELDGYGPLFRFTVDSISRLEPAELNEDLYKKVAPDQEITTEEAFREFLREQIGKEYQNDADKHFRNLTRERLLEETKLELPEDFLKQWILSNDEEKKLSAEEVEKDFEQYADSFRWQLLENHLIEKYGIQVPPEEVKAHVEHYVKQQLKQYGQMDVPQEMLDQYVQNIMSKQEEMKKVHDHLYDEKLMALYKEKLRLKEVPISYEDFVTLVTEKYKDRMPASAPAEDGPADTQESESENQ